MYKCILVSVFLKNYCITYWICNHVCVLPSPRSEAEDMVSEHNNFFKKGKKKTVSVQMYKCI
jgi:hypothetical protein